MNLADWIARYRPFLPSEAIRELSQVLEEEPPVIIGAPEGGEAMASQICRLNAQKQGARLWRNNVGAGTLLDGGFMRWGLCNESAAENKRVKSSDLIGIHPVLITSSMVGRTFGLFVAREVKKPGWKYRATEREQAQYRFINLVNSMGGDAKFSTGGY